MRNTTKNSASGILFDEPSSEKRLGNDPLTFFLDLVLSRISGSISDFEVATQSDFNPAPRL
jgi:hypothetical protein